MTNLDQLALINSLDKDNLAEHILALPNQIILGQQKAEKLVLPSAWEKCHQVVFCGMGGSALVGDLLTDLPMTEREIKFTVIRDYQVPLWVDKNTLVVLVSHSGQTQETVQAFKSAATNEAQLLIVAEQGEIEKLGQAENALVVDYDTFAPPRASLGYQLGIIFTLLKKAKFISGDLGAAIKLLTSLGQTYQQATPTENNRAKNIAYSLFDHLPVIVSSGILTSVGYRWKTQFNENAKNFAFIENLPEAMHNAIEGMDQPVRFRDDLIYFVLTNDFDNPALTAQIEKFKNILIDKKINYEIVAAEGNDVFSQKLSTLFLGDWISFYLAMLNNINPTPVETITKAKG
ncbi:MAG TPA: SIS domain-containing protein [bacterium]|nr:SIS domain-containing protein [bacterium]HPL95415.1 SIS domain-containing protein [bacterium]